MIFDVLETNEDNIRIIICQNIARSLGFQRKVIYFSLKRKVHGNMNEILIEDNMKFSLSLRFLGKLKNTNLRLLMFEFSFII